MSLNLLNNKHNILLYKSPQAQPMNVLEESFGYISDEEFNISKISNDVYKMIHEKMFWKDSYYIPKNNNIILKEFIKIKGIKFKLQDFNIPYRNLNKIRIIIVKFTDEYIPKGKLIDSLQGNTNTTAYYSPKDSIINLDKNMGVIFMSYDYFENKDIDEYEEILSHEIRHYFDNIIGIYAQEVKYTDSSIERAADFFSIDENSFFELKDIYKNNTKIFSQLLLLEKIIYISDPTELNAFYHSLIKLVLVYKKKYPNNMHINGIKNYLKEHDEHTYYLYAMKFIFESKLNYINAIMELSQDFIEALYFYFYNTSRINNISDEYIKKFNKLFLKYYNIYDYNINEMNIGEFKEGLKSFLTNHWIPFIYRLQKPKYMHIYNNINKHLYKIISER